MPDIRSKLKTSLRPCLRFQLLNKNKFPDFMAEDYDLFPGTKQAAHLSFQCSFKNTPTYYL